MSTKSTIFIIIAYTCTHLAASQTNITDFQQQLEKNNKSIQISSPDAIETTMNDQIKGLQTIQQNIDDFAFACDELATYHEQIYTLQDQMQTWLKNNQTILNTFKAEITTKDLTERTKLTNASQEFIDALNKNSADQDTLHKNATQELATKHQKLQALHNTFITTYQTTLEQILPITQSVVAQDRERRTTNFDNALASKTETEALHESYISFASQSTITSSFDTDILRSQYFNTTVIDEKTGKLSFNYDFYTKISWYEQKLAGIRALLINTYKISKKNTTSSVTVGYEECFTRDRKTSCKFIASALAQSKKDLSKYPPQANPIFTQDATQFKTQDAPASSFFGSWNYPIYRGIVYSVSLLNGSTKK